MISDISDTDSAWRGTLADSLSGGKCEASCLETTSAHDLFLFFVSNSTGVSPDTTEISIDAKLAGVTRDNAKRYHTRECGLLIPLQGSDTPKRFATRVYDLQA